MNFLRKNFEDSYFFFFFFFFLLLSINFFHFFLSPNKEIVTSLYFFSIHIGQSLLTVTSLALIADFLKLKTPFFVHRTFVFFCFLFMASFALEALFVLMMDVSFSDGLSIAFGADFDNFIELLYLSDLGVFSWIIFFVILFATPIIGLLFYNFCSYLEKKNSFKIRNINLGSCGIVALLFLLFLDLFSGRFSCETFDKNQKILPWKGICFKLNQQHFLLTHPIFYKAPRQRKELPLSRASYTYKPNIYLIVCESLRSDFIDPSWAPNLSKLKNQGSNIEKSYASSNCTHLSWFSLFHSKHPFYWSYRKSRDFKEGSLPLILLKEGGYQIHVYSSAQLRFYHFDEVIFGKNHYLADTFKIFSHYGTTSAATSDQQAVETLFNDSVFHKSYGNLYIIFLDSTHFNYSWEEKKGALFEPCEQLGWKHRLSNNPKNLINLKNRYKNAIGHVDGLYGQIYDHLQKKGSFDESFIVFLGDHGEEFKEEGKLFHASNLNRYQTQIPLYLKLGGNFSKNAVVSQVDVFPSILDALGLDREFFHAFDGLSVFSDIKRAYTLSMKYNASFFPYKFMISSSTGYKLFELTPHQRFFSSNKVKILSKIDEEEKKEYQNALEELFSKK